MTEEKQLDWETFRRLVWGGKVYAACDTCKDSTSGECNAVGSVPKSCLIWASLGDAGDLRVGILKIINDWEPRESGHVGGVFHLCQELRNLIDEPGCSCDSHEDAPQ